MKKLFTIKTIITVCLIIGLMLTVCACDSTTDKNDDDNTQTNTPADTASETTSVAESKTVATETEIIESGYKVTVVDENGNALGGVFLQICCGELCLAPYWTDASGKLVLDQDLSDYTVKAYLDGYTAEESEYAFEDDSTSLTIVMTKN